MTHSRTSVPRLRTLGLVLCLGMATSVPTLANEIVGGLLVQTLDGWDVAQRATSSVTTIRIYTSENDVIALYMRPQGATDPKIDMKKIFANGATLIESGKQEAHGLLNWETQLSNKNSYYVKAFSTVYKGKLFYGYSRSTYQSHAISNASEFLSSIMVPMRSLTDSSFSGKKYYLGWGAADSDDPAVMHNEVKYDVKHTHEIFTKDVGGGYLGSQFTGWTIATASKIRQEFSRIKNLITSDDMYVQYSSGHGYEAGLGIGLSYNEIRDNALSYPAKEIIIFIMACQSGGLIDSFNAKKTYWQNWKNEGRSLFVMSSSKTSENSQGGPVTSPHEPMGPWGSAGSAFGHALWRALAGESDGYLDGVKDGFISLGEISNYTVWKTQQIGDHTPVVTGSYEPNVIMNRVPSASFLRSLRGNDEERVATLDRALRVENASR